MAECLSGSMMLGSTSAQQHVTLEKDREYTIAHLGHDVSGVAGKTEPIFLGVSENATPAAVTADFSDENTSIALIDEWAVVIGPGIETLSYKNAGAGDDPAMLLSAGPRLRGAY